MKIAILSGKGGAGKTMVAVNLAHQQKKITYLDCDVETPNGHLFLRPQHLREEPVTLPVPQVDSQRCHGCRRCVEFCHNNALAWAGGGLLVFEQLCHYCGGCKLVCPSHAIGEISRPVGVITTGQSGEITVITGHLNPGESSGLPVLRALTQRLPPEGDAVIDCPPGCSCLVIQSIREADVCVLVAEPTLFGLHDMELVCQLVQIYNKPFGVVINKSYDVRNYVKCYCKQRQIKVLAEIPYQEQLAQLNARGELAADLPQYSKLFSKIYRNCKAVVEAAKTNAPHSGEQRAFL